MPIPNFTFCYLLLGEKGPPHFIQPRDVRKCGITRVAVTDGVSGPGHSFLCNWKTALGLNCAMGVFCRLTEILDVVFSC